MLLSHANPEDNEFTLWLALQLANGGYRVWCDLTKLLGGEVFWDDIEEVIKTRAVKVLYVLSPTSFILPEEIGQKSGDWVSEREGNYLGPWKVQRTCRYGATLHITGHTLAFGLGTFGEGG